MCRRRQIILVSVCVIIAFAAGQWTAMLFAPIGTKLRNAANGDARVIENQYVGNREETIRRSFGEPKSDQNGYHQLGNKPTLSLPTGPIRTLIFRHNGGTLWVWLEQRGDHWGCFQSCWYTDGVVF